MKNNKKILLGLLFAGMLFSVKAQKPEFHFVFDEIFDNREYFSDYAFPQTIFGARIDVGAMFRIDSCHAVAGGINYMFENGGKLLGVEPAVDLYYQYRGKNLKMNFGSFQRRELLAMPLYFLNDTLNYYRPNIQGALIDYSWKWGSILTFVDWTGRVSESVRESFLLGIDAKIGKDLLYIEPAFLMYHNAKSYSPGNLEHIQDNGIMSVLIGTNLSERTFFDELTISTGVLASYDRFRPDAYQWGKGWVTNFTMLYNIMGVKGVYYIGTPINFEYGDPFYSSGNYGRLDLFVDPFKNNKVKAKMGWNLHFAAGESVHHSQQILITVIF